MNAARRVLMIGLDAADGEVVRAMSGRGELPNLQRFLEEGVSGPLRSPARHYAGGVWPSFYTGRPVPSHGIFHNKLWRPETMRVEVPDDDWIAARPFWESLSQAGIGCCVLDVPMVLGRPRPVRGASVAGWGTHDLICKGSWPAALWPEIEQRFGAPRMPREHFGRQSRRSLEVLAQRLRATTGQVADIGAWLLGAHAWRFGCVVFGAVHRAGHYLHDFSQLDRDGEAPAALRGALADAYRQVDHGLGRLLSAVPEDTLVIAFSTHGMGPNPGWSDLFPDILAQLQAAASGSPPKRGLLYSIKRRVPHHWVRPLLERLPAAVTDRLVALWSRGMFDWTRTRFFPVPMDEAGYLRINLRGRERDGIVTPGAAYEALCRELERLVGSLYDEASGEPIAADMLRAWQSAAPDAPGRRLLPDLIVPWTDRPAARTRRLRSRVLPDFTYEVPARLPSGRSGNHNGNAWFAAAGPGVGRGPLAREHDVIDLAPTVFACLGVPPAPDFEGRPIDLGARS